MVKFRFFRVFSAIFGHFSGLRPVAKNRPPSAFGHKPSRPGASPMNAIGWKPSATARPRPLDLAKPAETRSKVAKPATRPAAR